MFESKSSLSLKVRWFIYRSTVKDIFAQVKAGGKYIGEVARGEGAKLSMLPTYKLHMRAHHLGEVTKSLNVGTLNAGGAFEEIKSGFSVIDKTTDVDVLHLHSLKMHSIAAKMQKKLEN